MNMLRLSALTILESRDALNLIPEGKVLINTINAHCYNVAQEDEAYAEALIGGDYLIPDGASIVMACRWLKGKSLPKERIAGWDLFVAEMQRLNSKAMAEGKKKRVMFMGSSERVLSLIRQRAANDYPCLEVVTYSPPYKPVFTDDDSAAIVRAINQARPELLWIGMTAPKQEKWTYQHWDELDIDCHVGTIGAVFDFYAGTVLRAPIWWQEHSLEWLYRFVMEPLRLWRRYVLGNPLFLWGVLREKMSMHSTNN